MTGKEWEKETRDTSPWGRCRGSVLLGNIDGHICGGKERSLVEMRGTWSSPSCENEEIVRTK